jgi:hypothetical protein
MGLPNQTTTITWDKFRARWQQPWYRHRVRHVARSLKSDGCSGPTTQWYQDGCFEHDIAYRTGFDPLGAPISRREADKRLRWYVQISSPLGVFSYISWRRWIGVRIGGYLAWHGRTGTCCV